jgi:hypothetical protein
MQGYGKDPKVDEFARKEELRKNKRRPVQETIAELGEGRGTDIATCMQAPLTESRHLRRRLRGAKKGKARSCWHTDSRQVSIRGSMRERRMRTRSYRVRSTCTLLDIDKASRNGLRRWRVFCRPNAMSPPIHSNAAIMVAEVLISTCFVYVLDLADQPVSYVYKTSFS